MYYTLYTVDTVQPAPYLPDPAHSLHLSDSSHSPHLADPTCLPHLPDSASQGECKQNLFTE